MEASMEKLAEDLAQREAHDSLTPTREAPGLTVQGGEAALPAPRSQPAVQRNIVPSSAAANARSGARPCAGGR
eukprot:9469809-Pyramimonas_sp.AAC.1